MPIAHVNGGRIHYEQAGEGPPLVLLLPQSTGPEGQIPVVRALASRHRVLTHHPRGLGKSGPAPVPQPIASMADDVVALLENLDIPLVHVVCHSTGCGVGQALAAAHPGHVVSLVLTSPWSYGDPFLTTMQNLRVAAARALDAERYAHFNAALLFPPEFRRVHEAGFQQMAEAAWQHPQDASDIECRLNAILSFDARSLWASIDCPTLVMTAPDDQLMPSWFARDTAAGIAGARLLMLDGGGHMLPETRAGKFVEEVFGFVSGLVGDGAIDPA